MKIRLAFVLLAAATVFTSTGVPQTTGTKLVMAAHWDNGSAVQGAVTLGKMNSSGPDTVIATETLSSKGLANITESLAPNSLYDVILTTSHGIQLVKFPVTTALINPNNLQRAEIQLVCHVADNSLASARIDVSMTF